MSHIPLLLNLTNLNSISNSHILYTILHPKPLLLLQAHSINQNHYLFIHLSKIVNSNSTQHSLNPYTLLYSFTYVPCHFAFLSFPESPMAKLYPYFYIFPSQNSPLYTKKPNRIN
jgi:hypothetical protein